MAKVLVENEDGELLMLKKSGEYESMGGKWEQPGGKLDGENRFEAARREVREETGLQLGELEDLVRIETEDDGKPVNVYVLYTDSFSGEIELGEEHDSFRWIERSEAKRLDWHRDASYIIPVIQYLEEYREAENSYSEGKSLNVVKLVIENSDGKFLALRKTAEDKVHSGHSYTLYGRMAGKWELPGGKFKEAANRFDAARRETLEETGLELGKLKDVVREEIEEKNSVNTYILYCKDWNGELKISKEHVDWKWVSAEEYLELDWHQDAGYGYPPMKFLNYYLS